VGRRSLADSMLAKADAVGCLLVSGVIVYVSSRLARRTIDALLDARPAGYRGRIMDAALKVNGVIEVERARIRRAGQPLLCRPYSWPGAQRHFPALRPGGRRDHARRAEDPA